MSLLIDWREFLHDCNICKTKTFDGTFLISPPMGPWRFWVCIPCNEYLNQIERKKEGEK